MGAFISGEKTKDTLGSSMHGTTFGSNPVCAAAACYVTSRLTDDFLDAVNRKGQLISDKIASAGIDNVISVRHLGMMIGIQVKSSPKDVLKKAFDAGLLVLTAGKDVVRLLPPLNISMSELDEGLSILLEVLK